MEVKGNYIFRFLNQVLVIFSINIIIQILLAALFGESARSMSSMYQFGSKGLASTTMLQFLLSAVTCSALMNFFFSERLFKKMLALWRIVLILLCIFFLHILYIIIFGWFTFDNYLAWIGFIICFSGGFVLSFLIMVIKTKLDNKQYDELLSHYKDQREEEDNE